MASINTIVKRKQYLWLGIVVVGTASAIGGAIDHDRNKPDTPENKCSWYSCLSL